MLPFFWTICFVRRQRFIRPWKRLRIPVISCRCVAIIFLILLKTRINFVSLRFRGSLFSIRAKKLAISWAFFEKNAMKRIRTILVICMAVYWYRFVLSLSRRLIKFREFFIFFGFTHFFFFFLTSFCFMAIFLVFWISAFQLIFLWSLRSRYSVLSFWILFSCHLFFLFFRCFW